MNLDSRVHNFIEKLEEQRAFYCRGDSTHTVVARNEAAEIISDALYSKTDRALVATDLRIAVDALQPGMPREQTMRQWMSALGHAVLVLLEEKKEVAVVDQKLILHPEFCEICAPQAMRLERRRCREHMEPKPEKTPEQKARELLYQMGFYDVAHSLSAGDVVELSNLIAERDRLRAALAQVRGCSTIHMAAMIANDALGARS